MLGLAHERRRQQPAFERRDHERRRRDLHRLRQDSLIAPCRFTQASRSEYELSLVPPDISQPRGCEADSDDCADAQCKGRGDPPVELGNPVGGVPAQKDAIGDEGQEDGRDHIQHIVLLREQSRESDERRRDYGDDSKPAVHTGTR